MALSATACAGPDEPLVIGHREFPTDAAVERAVEAPPILAPIPPTSLELAAPSFFAPQPEPTTTTSITAATATTMPSSTTLPASACEPADQRTPIAIVAPNRVFLPPSPGTYLYRNKGTFARSGADAANEAYEIESSRTIHDVRKLTTGVYDYAITAELGGTFTTTTYQLDTRAAADNSGGGLSITRIVTRLPERTTTFVPVPAVVLVDFPFEPGRSTGVRAATDPLSATTITYESEVGQKTRVDACGVPLDAFTVTFVANLADGSDTEVASIDAEYALAPQFGGLSLADMVTVDGMEGQSGVSRSNAAVINREPAPPAEPET